MSGYDHPTNLKAAEGLFEDLSRFEDDAGSPMGGPADDGKPSSQSQWDESFAADEGIALADGGLAGGAESDVFGGEAIRLGPTGPVPLLVQFEYGTTADQSMALFQELGASNVRIIRAENAADHLGTLYRIELPDSAASAEQIEAISSRAPVSYAEPDFAVSIDATSNDPGVVGGSLWGMYGDQSTIANPYGSQAAEAWEGGHTGSSGTVVGVIDTGIDYTHEDLYLNIWLNQREIPVALRDSLVDSDSDGLITFRDLNATANSSFVRDVNANGRIDAGDLLNDSAWENGVDEDGNGRVDDLIGWDFVNNDNDPYDDQGHGTHVSGTIGGIGGNGVGVAGVNWDVQLVGLKFLDANGSGYTSDAVQAVDYFTDAARNAVQGEHFVATNNSWGGGGYSRTLDAAVARGAAQDILFVAAAGNESQNTDISPNYPSNLSTTQAAGYEAVVSVASLTSSGQLSSFSNYGTQTVDLAAPGSTIYSTLPGDRYGAYSGTSMATPHVTGAIALYASANPNASAADVRAALLSTTVETNSLTGKVANAGRLDVSQLLGVDTAPTPEPPPPAPTDLIAGDASTTAILAAGVATASSIDFGGDQDWFRVSLHAGYTYDMALDAPSGSALDTYLRLLDGAGHTLAANDDAVGLNSRLSFTADADGTYFVSAQGYGSSTGEFVLAMSETLNSGETIVGNNRGNRLYGTSGGDEIYGLRGNDTLFGREGNDQIYGGYGNDRLIGGDGSDTFVFDTVLNRRYNVDRIYDFSDTEDSFLLDHLIFGQFDAATGVTNENIAIGSHAFDGNDYLIYNPSNGGLYYDANGSDRGGQQLFAVLATGLDLNADHFLIG
ncbi:MAG: S8 family serine peptidase [Rhodospirillaceae bacterium]|nr:S8 family serine peptidase [Rhodospirillaceae bacterium]